ncbi:DUF4159 domain-containing protein [Sorangium sp. So ce327]|uniref:DUF4159 domain-containing protein n=1 Tax=Sorangium sp. So ce327 TaxID=3133301 RepID=UPI003F606E78
MRRWLGRLGARRPRGRGGEAAPPPSRPAASAKPPRLAAARPRRLAVLALVLVSALLLLAVPRPVRAFGEEGAWNPRPLLTGDARWEGVRATAPARWSFELERRTSAPARRNPTTVRADDPALLAEPFALWGGEGDLPPLTEREVFGLRRFLALGGVLLVDDFAPGSGAFGRAARRELARVLPEGSPIPIGTENVVFRSFYLLPRAVGRVEGPPKLSAIVRGGMPQVIFSDHDLAGALARSEGGGPSVEVTPGGEAQRERAFRLAVNIAMYVLCSNYKDDQVHAPFLMRRRAVDDNRPRSAPARP